MSRALDAAAAANLTGEGSFPGKGPGKDIGGDGGAFPLLVDGLLRIR